MTATTVQPTTLPTTAAPRERRAVPPIGMGRIVGVELRKMFDTRAGFWMLMSIAILSVLATGAAILFAPDADIDFQLFASAIGIPMSIILPMIAILSVTGEYTQRTGLTTYTMIPRRGRTIAAKAISAVLVGVVSMFVALVVGALGNVVGSAIAGVDTTWNVSVSEFAGIVLAQVLGMTVGFMLGVLLRSSAAAIVAYFVYSLVLPSLLMLLAGAQSWFADLQPWVDFNYASSRLYDGTMTGEYWAQLGTSSVVWLVAPLAVGLALVMRSEVK
ncbi:ABC transporter permease subunit [Nocardioides sp. Soil805]|uniref:ABC transporter permease subunit n=1 Tax=Nocardioides sp. Soil805 TaxID=1736416 RepID=UPI0007023EB7|nr:ABC transporter permease subunit [Nocardioides sp. Soil805]KRF36259.1 ABC transporter permease [Nocardioides sp. Soil805]